MSNSGSAAQVISLPKGGGSLSGLGEKFSPDLFTGTGNFTVPIDLPPGRNAFQPELNLDYSTGNGNSSFGLGWALSIPGVSRKTSKGIPVYDDHKDIFILSGAEDLVPIESSSTQTQYRPRTEGLFARIHRHHQGKNDYWEVRSKNGLVSRYGTPESAGFDPAVVADPADRTKVFAWKLTHTSDPFGNRIEYEYERDSDENGPHHWDQLYLKRIRYANYGDGNEAEFLVTVTFHYADRPDPFSEYRSGFEIRTHKRCTHIEIHTHAEQLRHVRTYEFVYLDSKNNGVDQLPLNGASLLHQIRVIGHDGNETEELPPLEFGITRFEPERRNFFALTGQNLPSRSLASPDLALVDIHGNGLPDFVEMNGTVRYWRNLGNGQFDLPLQMKEAPAGIRLDDPGVQFIDANGDGRIDLLVANGSTNGYFPTRYNAQWDKHSFIRYQQAPSFDLQDPEVRLVDLDGDGITDAIRSGDRFELFFNNADDGWNRTSRIPRKHLEGFPNVNFSDPRVKWADMTGDGLQDIVLVHDGNIEYWPNMGYGKWGKLIHMTNSPRFPDGYDPKQVLIGDVDGDGVADLVFIDHCKVILWISQSGNCWSEPIEIDGTPPIANVDALQLVDLLGTGVSGVLWSKDAPTFRRDNYYFLDFTGGLKPYLLNEIVNQMGATTRVGYRSSTEEYRRDESSRDTHWQTPLPFPVQVVTRVEVIDNLSQGKLTTEYTYHHGYWDGAEREFRGFGRVEQCDTESFDTYNSNGLHSDGSDFLGFNTDDSKPFFSPPTLTKTWFHLGPVGDEFGDWDEIDYDPAYWQGDPTMLERPSAVSEFLEKLPRRDKRDALRALRGSVLRTELFALDGSDREERPYTVAESLYGLREEEPPATEKDRLRLFLPHQLAQRTTQWERGDDPMTQFVFTSDYDAYGQPRQQTQIACPRGWRTLHDTSGQPFLATRSVTRYAQRDDLNVFIVDRIARTTSYEITNDGSKPINILKGLANNSSALHIFGQSLSYYDGDAFLGLPLGQLGNYGAAVRSETLVLTEEILHEAYKSGSTVATPAEMPPYFVVPGIAPAWTPEYPEVFRHGLAPLAGYVFYPGDANHTRGYYIATTRQQYDFHITGTGRGLPLAMRDPLGRDTTIGYDKYQMLPAEVIDPAGLRIQAVYDYRVLQPQQVTDPNNNQTAYLFSPLGLLKETWIKGDPQQQQGDRQRPSVRLDYDFWAYAKSPSDNRQPVWVRTISQLHHDTESDIPLPQRDDTIETLEYSDGFGRLLQTRSQGEDIRFGDSVFGNGVLPASQTDTQATKVDVIGIAASPGAENIIVSGWKVYNNKGWVAKQYEPFFSTGWNYAPPKEAELGQQVSMHYDPRGQLIRSVNPDGSEQRVLYGAPKNLSDPNTYDPTPWQAFTYDANDNAGRTHPVISADYQHHWNTPSSIVIDALGRSVEETERNGSDPTTDWYTSRSRYDIRGNPLAISDPMGRVAFTYIYDLANNPLRIDSIDAGLRQTVFDAAGNTIELRSSKASLILKSYDPISRPTHVWARDNAVDALTLRETMIYGDDTDSGLTPVDAAQRNLLGKLYRHYDEAGSIALETYDFKSNLLEQVRQVISDSQILSVFEGAAADNWQINAFRAQWQPPAGVTFQQHVTTMLDPTDYRISSTFDALNRVKTLQYPQDVDGQRKHLRPEYNRAGALQRIMLDNDSYVQHIAYNAKGQRTLIAYGNGVLTRYAYDAHTFRLLRLRSERYTTPASNSFHPLGIALQDFAYEYDLIGNILQLQDRVPGSGVPNTLAGMDALDRAFAYDPIYRLLSASGREQATLPSEPPWQDDIKSQAPTLTRPYTQQYRYDSVGNLAELKHKANNGDFTRELVAGPANNRLTTVRIGQQAFDYVYDSNGNMIRETSSRHFEWDHSDQLKAFRTQAGNAEPSVHAHHLYDSGGQRVKKFVRKQGGDVEITTYIGDLFEHHRWQENGIAIHNNRLHVMDDQSRIALLRVGAKHPSDQGEAIQYQLGDLLGSSHLVVNETASWTNREEFTPYGETSSGSFARKRYRFTGKERDEESGLNYHTTRFYSPWTCRWISADPAGHIDGLNTYAYVRNNPIGFVDGNGLQSKKPAPPGSVEIHTALVEQAPQVFVSPGSPQPARPPRPPGAEWVDAVVQPLFPTLDLSSEKPTIKYETIPRFQLRQPARSAPVPGSAEVRAAIKSQIPSFKLDPPVWIQHTGYAELDRVLRSTLQTTDDYRESSIYQNLAREWAVVDEMDRMLSREVERLSVTLAPRRSTDPEARQMGWSQGSSDSVRHHRNVAQELTSMVTGWGGLFAGIAYGLGGSHDNARNLARFGATVPHSGKLGFKGSLGRVRYTTDTTQSPVPQIPGR